jgi:tetratricopeptide (TPR) repeat protein
MDQREYDKAIADFDEMIRSDPGNWLAYYNRGLVWTRKKEFGKAIADCEEAIRENPQHCLPYCNIAWILATCPDSQFRDGEEAVEVATEACEMSEWEDAFCIDTLAAAYAETADFDRAISLQEKANVLYPDDEEKRKGSERIALYRKRIPYRDEGN